MKNRYLSIFLGLTAYAFAACEPKIDAPIPSTGGGINISNYVAIGNSLSAGFADAGLYLEGQQVAWPVILAEQFKLAGGGDFYAPLFEPNQAKGLGYKKLIGFTATGSPIIVDEPGSPDAIKERTALAYDPVGNPDSVVLQPFTGPNNNFGVPGIRVENLYTVGYGFKNPYYGRLLNSTEYMTGKPYGSRVAETNPTFFTCWLGNNDVLGFATAGGYPDLGKITPLGDFATNYNRIIDEMLNSANSPRGALANIPDVTSVPYFTSVGPALKVGLAAAGAPAFLEYHLDSALINTILPRLLGQLPLLDPVNLRPSPVSAIATLNPVTKTWDGNVFFTLTFAPYAGDVGKPTAKAWRALFSQLLKTYASLIPIPITVDDLMRQEVSGIDSTKPFGLDPANPIPDVFVLNGAETAQARAATVAYNEIIKSTVDRHADKLVLIDANGFLNKANAGLIYDGIGTNASFISGGIFSLDGVHLTPRGNAAAANEFIIGINKKFGSTIPMVNVGRYRGVRLP